MTKEFIAVVGATASGKSSLAIELAKRLDGEIVSCDSMQIYKTMDIGTAKATKAEQAEAVHHMIDIIEPGEEFSAGDFCILAEKAIEDILSRGKVPIVCGGTFLYLDSLTSSYTRSETSKDEALRAELEEYAKKEGNHALHEMLRQIDPESADAIHENNVKRVIRAIEIFKTSGKTKTEWDILSKEAEAPYKAHTVVIDYNNREILYDRINRRVDIMFEEGLETEAKMLYDRGILTPDTTAGQAIGYKEFIEYFEGLISIQEVSEKIKQFSRNYAKRQMTWLKRYKNAIRVTPDEGEKLLTTADLAEKAIEALKAQGCNLLK